MDGILGIQPITGIIVAITVVISFIAFKQPALFGQLAFNVGAIRSGEVHRLVSSTMLHADWGHLLFNMISFFSFGSSLEAGVGSIPMLIAYVLSSLGGDLLALFMNRNRPDYTAVGASGAVTGIIFISILLNPGGGIYIIPIPFAIPSWLFGILFVLISVYGLGRGNSAIGHEAHLGGALTGIIITTLVFPDVFLSRPFLWFAITLPIIGLVIISYMRPELIRPRR